MALYFGSAWYPEHWQEDRWIEDVRLMRDAHMNVVRVAEYAWSRLEPDDNHFDFDWLDRAIDLAITHGMKVVLGTPTNSPPAWVIHKYPDTLQISPEGRKLSHGGRGHYSPTSPNYLRLGRRITEEMAKRYGQNPDIIGWQIDNEFWAMSYDAECRRQFQEWLKAHYGTLDALNEHWSTAYWSQTYFDWSQIPLPAGPNNPGLMLAYKLFTTSVYRAYQCNLIDSIRRYAAPHQKITHNCLGFVAPLDYYDINADLDFASWDHYVGMGDPDLAIHSFESSLIRGLKRQNYWIMETQPGWVNWAKVNTAHHRGEVRAMAWHDVGHGADAVLYWQWRSAPNGQEQYHGNLIAPDGKPRPIYKEIAQIGREFESLRDVLAGTTLQADAAILHHYDSRWALEWQPHHYQFDAVKYAHSFYKPLREALHNVDVIHPKALLTGYKLVIAPMMHVLDDEITANLLRYVESGGHLVLGVRSGVKDVHNALLPMRQPGSALSSLLGAHVEEYYALLDAIPVEGAWSGQASIWAEWLEVDTQDAETLLRYGTANGWLDGQAALVTRRVGNGRITYMGAWFDDALMQYITGHLLEISEITPMIVPMPPGVELCRRTRQGSDTVSNTNNDHLYIVINHTSAPQEVQLSFPTRDLLTSNTHAGAISIPPRGVVVLQGNGS